MQKKTLTHVVGNVGRWFFLIIIYIKYPIDVYMHIVLISDSLVLRIPFGCCEKTIRATSVRTANSKSLRGFSLQEVMFLRPMPLAKVLLSYTAFLGGLHLLVLRNHLQRELFLDQLAALPQLDLDAIGVGDEGAGLGAGVELGGAKLLRWPVVEGEDLAPGLAIDDREQPEEGGARHSLEWRRARVSRHIRRRSRQRETSIA